ncbi:MAG: hypothetical protein HYX55_01925 [Chloroflexi bacterium]|nr:hypothetical protein [Chloroflexota bacterium]
MIPMRSAWVRLPAVLLILAATAACSVLQPGASGSSRPADPVHAQAQDALARWADAAAKSGGATVSFVGDQTGQLGDWEARVGDNNKPALMAGLLVAPTALSDARPDRGKVHWLGGDSIDVDVLSAADALADLIAAAKANGGECGDCRPLRVTDADLATGLAETTRGPAEAPLWVFTIEGTAVRVTRVAVDPSVTVVPPPFNAAHPPAGLSIDFAVGGPESTKLTVSFVGATKTADQACGADYTAEAVESDLAVVVIVIAHENATQGSCTLAGKTRTATATLDAPLGKRAVLEVTQGLPVPLHAP